MCHVIRNSQIYQGEGIFDFIPMAINLIKDNATTIKYVGMAGASVAMAGKNIVDAVKSTHELSKAKEEKNQAVLKTLKIMDEIAELRKKQKSEASKSKSESVKSETKSPDQLQSSTELERFLQQVKSGKGLKKF